MIWVREVRYFHSRNPDHGKWSQGCLQHVGSLARLGHNHAPFPQLGHHPPHGHVGDAPLLGKVTFGGQPCPPHQPRALTRAELIQEALRLRKYLGWMITLNDDWADTDYDEELSQVMISGGVYIAPPDSETLRLLLRTAQPGVGRREQERRMPCRRAGSSVLEHVLQVKCGGLAGWPGVVAG
jgi:hypothetical protein